MLSYNINDIISMYYDSVINIKIDYIKYKVISQRKIKNKTSFFLELDND